MMLNQLLFFKTVAEYGTISHAAKQLDVTGPAISIALTKLEKELNVTLFSRTGNRLTLTEHGRIFQARVNQILQDLDTAAEEVRILDTQLNLNP